MSDYSSNFPTQSPTFAFDAKAGKLDSRVSFSRADTPPTYAAPSAVHYWSNEKHLSSENLLRYSNPNNALWVESKNATITTNSVSAPDGSTTASKITEDSTAGVQHRTYISQTVGSGETFTYVGYLKANGRTIVQLSTTGAGASAGVEFNLSGSGTATTRSGSPTNASITQIGTDWYKCSFQVSSTSSALLYTQIVMCDAANSTVYDGDGTSGVYAWGFSLSSTGETVLNETSGSIHREFAPTLKSVANAGDPRFEYSPTDGQSVGTALGLLVESQSSNLLTYSEDWTNSDFTKFVAITSNAGIAPTGELSADLVAATSSTGDHLTRQSLTIVSGQTFTMSVFAKASGCNFVRIGGASTAAMPAQASFDLANGTVGTVDYGTAKIEDVGNGYYRCSVTGTAASSSSTHFQVRLMQSDNTPSWTGDDFSGVLLFGQMAEQSSSVSSYIKTNSSSVSRAADSCSLVSAPLLDNGSGGLTVEYDMQLANETSYVLQTARSSGATNNDGVTVYNGGMLVNGSGTNTRLSNTTSNVFHKVAASWESGSQKISRDGSAVAEDTTTVVPQSGTDKLHIGTRQDGGEPVNGHIRNIAIYSEPLSSTNLTTLSQL